MNRFSKLKMPKAGKRPMMMAITGIVIVFLFYFFFMRGSSSMSEGFVEGAAGTAAVDKYNARKKLIDSGVPIDPNKNPGAYKQQHAAEAKK